MEDEDEVPVDSRFVTGAGGHHAVVKEEDPLGDSGDKCGPLRKRSHHSNNHNSMVLASGDDVRTKIKTEDEHVYKSGGISPVTLVTHGSSGVSTTNSVTYTGNSMKKRTIKVLVQPPAKSLGGPVSADPPFPSSSCPPSTGLSVAHFPTEASIKLKRKKSLTLKATTGVKRRKIIRKKAANQPLVSKSYLQTTTRKLLARKQIDDSQQLQLERLITSDSDSRNKLLAYSPTKREKIRRQLATNTSKQKQKCASSFPAKVFSRNQVKNKLSKSKKTEKRKISSGFGMNAKMPKTTLVSTNRALGKKGSHALSRVRNSRKSGAIQVKVENILTRNICENGLKNKNSPLPKARLAQENKKIRHKGSKNADPEPSKMSDCSGTRRSPTYKKPRFDCDICGKRFSANRRQKLWRHKMEAHGGSPEEVAASLGVSSVVKCEFCPEWFFPGFLKSHVQKIHHQQFEKWWLQEQRRNNESGMMFNKMRLYCVLCQQRVFVNALTKHFQTAHGIIENSSWPCSECPEERTFAKRSLWLFHMKSSHDNKMNTKELLKMVENPNTSDLEIADQVAPLSAAKPPQYEMKQPEDVMNESLIHPEGREKCDECNNFFNPAYLSIHKKANHSIKNPRAQCPVCPSTAVDGIGVWNHYCNTHLRESELQDVDPVPPNLRSDLVPTQSNNPVVVPLGGSPFCDKCGREFSKNNSLKRHILNVHGGDDQSREYFHCAYCPKKYNVKGNLDDHVRRFHEQTVITKCHQCKRDLQSSGKLWKHMVDTHNISASEAADYCKVSIVRCTVCGEHLLADRQFANHVKSQHPEQSVALLEARKCQLELQMEKQLREENDLQQDEAETWNVADLTKLSTGQVENILRREKHLRQTILQKSKSVYNRTVARVRDDGECPECGKVLTMGLSGHRWKMHGVELEGGCACPVEGCTTRSTTPSSLRRHIRGCHTTPLDEKIVSRKIIRVVEEGKLCTVYLCTLCQKYLYYYDEIKAHVVAVHPEFCKDLVTPGQVSCPHCTETLENDKLLRKHVEERHPEKMWSCPDCGKMVLSPADLEKHFTEDHNNAKEKRDGDDKVYLKLKWPGLSESDKIKEKVAIKGKKTLRKVGGSKNRARPINKRPCKDDNENDKDSSNGEESEFHSDGHEKNATGNKAAKSKKVDRCFPKGNASRAKNSRKLDGDSEEHNLVDEKPTTPKNQVNRRTNLNGKRKSASGKKKQNVTLKTGGSSGGGKNKKPVPIQLPTRVSTRTKKRVETKCSPFNGDSNNYSSESYQISRAASRRGRNQEGESGNNVSGSNGSIQIRADNLERKRRLVIQLERLTEEQIERHSGSSTINMTTQVGNAEVVYDNEIIDIKMEY